MEERIRIESRLEVQTYLQNLRYALDHGADIDFQLERFVDKNRDSRFTNRITMDSLFSNEDPKVSLSRELRLLTVENYMRTVKDVRFPNRSEMREFGKTYHGNEDVYIKIRVRLLGDYGVDKIFVMSFHFAEQSFTDEDFPYRKKV